MPHRKSPHTAHQFPRIRKATIDLLKAAKRKNMIHSMIEVDISTARKKLREHKKQTSQYLSFTGYVIRCIARAVEKHRRVHAYRNWGNKLIEFDDVDVSTTMERKVGGRSEVIAKIIRSANTKTVHEISREIENEKTQDVEKAEVYRFIRLYLAVPAFIRRLVFRILDRSPHQMKKRAGTIMVTSVMTAGGGAGWGIPIASHTLNVTIGGIVKRPVEKEGMIENREHLCLTVSFDHDIVDGAPAARFIRELTGLIQSGKEIPA